MDGELTIDACVIARWRAVLDDLASLLPANAVLAMLDAEMAATLDDWGHE